MPLLRGKGSLGASYHNDLRSFWGFLIIDALRGFRWHLEPEWIDPHLHSRECRALGMILDPPLDREGARNTQDGLPFPDAEKLTSEGRVR